MNKRTPVVNMGGDWEETIVQQARHLGQSQIRRAVFNVVYGRGTKPKSKKQIMALAGLGSGKSQQVQNELDYLARHHLIVKTENDGTVDDGSRYVYDKEPSVRANRDSIVRRADNKDLARRTPTKRRPASVVLRPLAAKRKELRGRRKLSVLYLTASPDEQSPLRVDLEVRMVQAAVRGSIFRDSIDVQFRPAADFNAIIDGLNDHRPQIVHFSGHSDVDGIAGDDGKITNVRSQDISYDLLAKALSATDNPPQVVVLNSCESSASKRALLAATSILISMRAGVSDIAANAFAPRFYGAIASGQSVKAAFDQGVVAVQAASLSEKDTPELSARAGVDPGKLVLT